MKWKDVGSKVAQYAPLLGGLLGGAPGTAVGGLVAAAFGTEAEPDKVLEAINSDPNAALKLREIETTHKTELERLHVQAEANRLSADTARIEAVNATMRGEAQAKQWWVSGWRPYWGYMSATVFGVAVIYFCRAMFRIIDEGKFDILMTLPAIIGAFVGLFAIPGAICGVTSWHRGKMQRVKAGEQPGKGLITALAERISKK